jgi:hypothetical protein
MLRWASIVVLLGEGLLGCATGSRVGPIPAQEVHLFLLAGQSNMAGRGEVSPDQNVPIPGVMA